MDASRVRKEIGNRDDPASAQHLDRTQCVGNVRRWCDHLAAEAFGHVSRDRVRPRAGHEHVAVEPEELLSWSPELRAVLDKTVAVAGPELEQLLEVEPVGIGEKAVGGTDGHNPRPRPGARPRGPGADLAEALDRTPRASERVTEMAKTRLCGRLHAVTGRQVVHSEPLVRLGPERKRILVAFEEVGR